MKRRHLLLVALSLIISICTCFCLAACDSCNDEPAPVVLSVPVVTIDDDGVAGWDAVEHASGYAYKISGGEEQTTDATSVTLTDGQSIQVKAVGDGKNYSDSGFSEAKTYTAGTTPVTPVKLGTPEVTIDANGLASWTAVDHASKYVVKIGETETEQTELSIQLTDGQSIQVKAVGDGTNYTTGDFSEAQTYTAGTTPVTPVKLGTPEVIIDANGLASWTAVDHASKYVVKIGETETEQTELSIQLTDGQSIQVKAVGDGTNYTTGDFSEAQTYTAGTTPVTPVKLDTPVVMINNEGLASWRPVDHASKYVVKIGETETEQTELSIQLTDGQSIQVKAVGDGTNYTTGDFSEAQTYNAGTVTPPPEKPEKLMAPTVEVDDNGIASWTAIPNATKYVYRINDGEDQQTTELSVQLQKGQKIIVKAIGDGEKFLDSNFSAARSYIVSKLAASLSFADKANRPDYDAATRQVWTQNGITFTNLKEKSSPIGDYCNPVRLYKNSSIIIEYGNMVKIVFNCNRAEDVTNLKASFVRSSITATSKDKAVTVKFNVALDKFDIAELDNQVRLDSIDVYVEKVPVPLTVPVVTVNEEGVASWTKDENAVRYEYSLDEGATYTEITETSFQFTQKGQSIIVKAVGDGEDFITVTSQKVVCDWTEVKLKAPVVEINKAGVARWEAVEHAAKYVYVIDDGEETETTELEVTGLTDGQSIKVKAIGQLRYTDSDFSEAVTYTAPTEASQLNKDLIEITIARDGTVTVTHPNASSFKYKINDGEETALALDATFTLTSGQSVTVKAVGDGTIYTDSVYTTAVTYTAPATLGVPENVVIVIEGTTAGKVVASWNAVPNATKYAYVVNGGDAVETQDNTVTIDLAEADTFKVMAVGDTNTATDGNFGGFFDDGEYCTETEFVIDNEKTYTVAEIMPVVKYYGTSASTKEFTVKGIVSTNKAYSASYKNIDITLKEGEFVFDVYRAAFAQGVGSATTAADELVNWTVTATGKLLFYNSTKAQLTSGKVTAIEMSAADRVAYAKEALKLNETYITDFVLPLEGKHGTTISWTIANTDDVSMSIEIDADGKSVTILQGETDVEITLTATITYGEGNNAVTDTKDITFTILAEGNEPPEATTLATLDFAYMTTITSTKVGSYTTTWNASADNVKWTIANFNNNNLGWRYIKAGRKGNASVASISATISGTVSSVDVTVDAVTTSIINSAKLIVSNSSEEVTTIDVKEIFVKGLVSINIPNEYQGKGYTYKLELDMASHTANGPIQISKVVCNGYSA